MNALILKPIFNPGVFMNAIELDAIVHDGKVIVSIPEAYREQWNDKAVRVIILASDESAAKPKTSLLSTLKQIKISGSTDFSEKSGEEDLRGF